VVKLVQAGWRPPPLTDRQAQRLLDDMEFAHAAATLELTGPELEALVCAADGLTGTEAADRMGVSLDTGKDRLDRARLRLGARNTAHAIAEAFRAGLLT
jgi:DNA-binding CsgD family transcriptional regulator